MSRFGVVGYLFIYFKNNDHTNLFLNTYSEKKTNFIFVKLVHPTQSKLIHSLSSRQMDVNKLNTPQALNISGSFLVQVLASVTITYLYNRHSDSKLTCHCNPGTTQESGGQRVPLNFLNTMVSRQTDTAQHTTKMPVIGSRAANSPKSVV